MSTLESAQKIKISKDNKYQRCEKHDDLFEKIQIDQIFLKSSKQVYNFQENRTKIFNSSGVTQMIESFLKFHILKTVLMNTMQGFHVLKSKSYS